MTAKARRSAGPSMLRCAIRRGGSGVAELALGGLQDAGAVFVVALVAADLLGAVVVALGQHGLDLADGQLVIARPRLVAAQRADPVEDRAAVLLAALVGVDLGEVDLGELG